MKIDDAHNAIGREVRYTPKGDYTGKTIEYGIITGANHRNVFVRYHGDIHSKSTDPEDLEVMMWK